MTDGGKAYIQELSKFTQPAKPFKRQLTEDEHKIMRENFVDYSWSSNVDRKGRILLSGGDCEGGKIFVYEGDLKHLVPIPDFVETGEMYDGMSTMDLLRSLKKPIALLMIGAIMYATYLLITIS